MALQYILDGYNIIMSDAGAALSFSRGTLEQQRQALITAVKEKRPHGSHNNSVTVVFDGKSENPIWRDSFSIGHDGEVTIAFSEGASGDDVIERMVLESPHPASIVVVTDDRGIHRRLGTTGARIMPVREFCARLSAPPPRDDGSSSADPDARSAIDDEFKKRWLK